MNLSWLFGAVARHADDAGAGGGEIVGQRGEILRFAGAARRVVLGIEIEHQLAAGRGEIDRLAVAGGNRQRRCLVAFARSCVPSLCLLPALRRSCAARRRSPPTSAFQSGCPHRLATRARAGGRRHRPPCRARPAAGRREAAEQAQVGVGFARRAAPPRPARRSPVRAAGRGRCRWSAAACGPRIRGRRARPAPA